MALLRYSIKQILGVIAVIGLAIAVLNSVSILITGLLFIGVIGLLLGAVLAVVYFRGVHQAFWLGVVLFGATYMTIAFSSWFESTRYVLDAPLQAIRKAVWTVQTGPDEDTTGFEGDTEYDEATGTTFWQPAWHTFGPSAHCIAALGFAFLGGWVSRGIYVKSRISQTTKRDN